MLSYRDGPPLAWSSRALEQLVRLRRLDAPRAGQKPLVRVAAERTIVDHYGRSIRVYDVETHVRRGMGSTRYTTRFYVDFTGSIVRHEAS